MSDRHIDTESLDHCGEGRTEDCVSTVWEVEKEAMGRGGVGVYLRNIWTDIGE